MSDSATGPALEVECAACHRMVPWWKASGCRDSSSACKFCVAEAPRRLVDLEARLARLEAALLYPLTTVSAADYGPAVAHWKRVACPDCGPVDLVADVFDGDTPVSGPCPGCGDRLYFA